MMRLRGLLVGTGVNRLPRTSPRACSQSWGVSVAAPSPRMEGGKGVRFSCRLAAALVLAALVCLPAFAANVIPGVARPVQAQTGAAEAQVSPATVPPQPGSPSPVDGTLDLTGPWKFRTDRDENGEALGWQKPEFDDNRWAILNVTEWWESQGITAPNLRWPVLEASEGYNGYAWYRRHFTVPTEWATQRVTLSIGAIDDLDWTYVNGQLVGSTTEWDSSWDDPREYVIPIGLLRPNADNVIAIRVLDHHGAGGIYQGPVEFRLGTSRVALTPQPGRYTSIRSSVVNMGGSVTIAENEKVEGDVVAVGGSAHIRGYVTGNVVAVGGSVTADSGSLIDGDAVAVGGAVRRDSDAVIRGQMVQAGPNFAWVWKPDWWNRVHYNGIAGGGFFGGLAIWGFVSALCVLLFKRRVEVMADALPEHPATAAGIGLLGFALTPASIISVILIEVFVIILLAITVVGIIAIPAVAAAMVAVVVAPLGVLLIGMSGVFLSLGQAVAQQLRRDVVTRRLGAEMNPIWATLLGVLVICIAGVIPLIGPLVWATAIIFGYGLALMTGIGSAERYSYRTARWSGRPRRGPKVEHSESLEPATAVPPGESDTSGAPSSEAAISSETPIEEAARPKEQIRPEGLESELDSGGLEDASGES